MNISPAMARRAGRGLPVVTGLVVLCLLFAPGAAVAGGRLPAFFYGVTVDAVDDLPAIVESLAHLRQKVVVRVVFDETAPPEAYLPAVRALHAVAWVMGELLDSSAMNAFHTTPAAYAGRARRYLERLGPWVDLWEIGNEVNGEWLGDPVLVVARIEAALSVMRLAGAPTALTLYYNAGCWEEPDHELFTWVLRYLPPALRRQFDHLLVSYYEDDCEGLRPDWLRVFQRLGRLFPRSRLGMGEVGTETPGHKRDLLRRYYRLRIHHPRFEGGYFWWYFRQDMVPRGKPLWRELNELITPPSG